MSSPSAFLWVDVDDELYSGIFNSSALTNALAFPLPMTILQIHACPSSISLLKEKPETVQAVKTTRTI